jgi:hypothetical protein
LAYYKKKLEVWGALIKLEVWICLPLAHLDGLWNFNFGQNLWDRVWCYWEHHGHIMCWIAQLNGQKGCRSSTIRGGSCICPIHAW